MSYEQTWEEIQTDPRFAKLSPEARQKARHLFAKYLGVTRDKETRTAFIRKEIIGGAPAPEKNYAQHLADDLIENTAGRVGQFATGAARTVLDEGPTGLIRRGISKATDAALDTFVSRPLGLPTSREMGTDTGRILPNVKPEDRELAENLGGFVGGFADPINVAAPLNVFAKGPQVGLSALQQAARGAVGAGATNAALAGATSIGTQALDNGELDPARTATDTALGGLLGGLLGAGAGTLAARQPGRALVPVEQPRGFRDIAPEQGPQALPAANQPLALPPAARPALPPGSGRVVTPAEVQDAMGQNAARYYAERALENPIQAGPMPKPDGHPSDLPALPPASQIQTGPVPGAARPNTGLYGQAGQRPPSAPVVRPETAPAQPAAPEPVAPDVSAPAARAGYNLDEILEMQEQLTRNMPEPRAVIKATSGDIPVVDATKTQGGIEYTTPDGRLGWVSDESVRTVERYSSVPRQSARPASEPGRPGGTIEQLRLLFSDESGSAAAEAATGIPQAAQAARLAGRAARGVDRGIEAGLDFVSDQTVGRAARGVVAAKEAVKRGMARTPGARHFISDADMPTGYRDLQTDIDNQARMEVRQLDQLADDLESRGVDQERLYDTVTDRSQVSPEAAEVRAATTPISQELRDLGSLTEAQFKAWEDQYLPRTYLNKDDPLGQAYRQAKRTMKGFKHRGKKLAMDQKTFDMFSRPWEVAGESADGRLILRDASNGQTRLVTKKNAANFLGQWKSLGKTNGGKVQGWRDWTATEREGMGEVKNVSLALRKMAQKVERDLKNGRLLKAISENPDWAVPMQGSAKPEGWVAFDAARVDGDGPVKWGALADHYVHPAVARDLQAAIDLQLRLDKIQSFTGQRLWKKSKTVWNVVSHMNQLGSNLATLELAGGSVFDMPKAIQSLKNQDELFQQMDQLGLFGDGFRATELAAEMEAGRINWSNPLDVTVKGARKLDQFLGDAYQASDDMTRAAYVIGKVEQGIPLEQAVREARDRFYNGNTIRSTFARVGSATIFPFVKPWIYAVDKLPELIATNPAKAVKLVLYWKALETVTKMASGETDEQRRGKEAMLPDYQRGPGKILWTGAKDSMGQDLMVDVQNMNPIGQAYDTTERTALPEWEIPGVSDATGLKVGPPSALVPGGPLGTAFALGGNYDPFYQRQLKTDTENHTGEFLMRELLPSTLTNSLPKLAAALQGRPDHTGRRYDALTAALNVLPGLKVQPFDPEMAYDRLSARFERQAREIDMAVSSLDRDLETGKIDEAQYEREMARYEQMYERLVQEEEKRLTEAEPGLTTGRAR